MLRKWSALVVFGTVLVGYLGLTVIGLILLVSGGLGPDVEANVVNRIGMAVLGVLLFPLDAIQTRFFLGRPLPGSEWLWIIGVAASWASVATFGFALLRRVRRD